MYIYIYIYIYIYKYLYILYTLYIIYYIYWVYVKYKKYSNSKMIQYYGCETQRNGSYWLLHNKNKTRMKTKAEITLLNLQVEIVRAMNYCDYLDKVCCLFYYNSSLFMQWSHSEIHAAYA